MGVDRSITGSSSEVLALSVGNVFSISLDVTLGESKVDQEDLVTGLVESGTEVIGLDVTVEEVPVVHVLDTGDHLVYEHEHSLETELTEGIFE